MSYPDGRYVIPDPFTDVYFAWLDHGQTLEAVRMDHEAAEFLLHLIRDDDVDEIALTRGDIRVKVTKEKP